MGTYSNLEAEISKVMEGMLAFPSSGNKKKKQSVANLPGQLFAHPLELSRIIQAGLPFELFATIRDRSVLTEKEWSHILDISEKTLGRYAKEGPDFRFRRYQSEKILDVAQVTDLGLEFFDSPSDFRQWLDTPNYQFRDRRPMDMISDAHGCALICDELSRMEHGIFA